MAQSFDLLRHEHKVRQVTYESLNAIHNENKSQLEIENCSLE